MCHVLIIEDDAMIAMLLQDVLEEVGATSFSFAGTEADAVTLAIQRRPAVITSDVRLITGTGPRAVAAIHEKIGEVPVMFITATPFDCEPDSPNTLVLTKPVSLLQLQSAFERLAPPV